MGMITKSTEPDVIEGLECRKKDLLERIGREQHKVYRIDQLLGQLRSDPALVKAAAILSEIKSIL